MNRTERLYAISEELRRSGSAGATGARLAALLEVSGRTVKRDISALQQAGAPIWGQAGPGGGYVLDERASLPPVNFTPAQAVAVAVALAMLPPGGPFSADGTAARGKVWDTLGPGDRARAQQLAERVMVRGEPEQVPGTARAIEQALDLSRVLALQYRDRTGATSRRSVEPILLARNGPHWYLVGWCQGRQAVRWFRLDRIERADVTRVRYTPRDVADVGQPPADVVVAAPGAAAPGKPGPAESGPTESGPTEPGPTTV